MYDTGPPAEARQHASYGGPLWKILPNQFALARYCTALWHMLELTKSRMKISSSGVGVVHAVHGLRATATATKLHPRL